MKTLLVNDQIEATNIRLIKEGDHVVMTLAAALREADEAGLDLVEVNSDEIPVCKLMDYKRHLYETKKASKAKDKKQRASTVKVKEVQLSIDIQENDILTKRKQVAKFMQKGHQVRVSIRLHGRAKGNNEMAQLAQDKIEIFIQGCIPFKFVQKTTRAGDTISAIIK